MARAKSYSMSWYGKAAKRVIYDPVTGIFTWAVEVGPRHIGDVAGVVRSNGYRYLTIHCDLISAHRLAWFIFYGIPAPIDMQIDHINGDPDDNRIANLRLASQADNNRNRNAKKTSGAYSQYRGVTFDKKRGLWMMLAKTPQKRFQKRYRTEIEAARAYDSIMREHGTPFNHLNFSGE